MSLGHLLSDTRHVGFDLLVLLEELSLPLLQLLDFPLLPLHVRPQCLFPRRLFRDMLVCRLQPDLEGCQQFKSRNVLFQGDMFETRFEIRKISHWPITHHDRNSAISSVKSLSFF